MAFSLPLPFYLSDWCGTAAGDKIWLLSSRGRDALDPKEAGRLQCHQHPLPCILRLDSHFFWLHNTRGKHRRRLRQREGGERARKSHGKRWLPCQGWWCWGISVAHRAWHCPFHPPSSSLSLQPRGICHQLHPQPQLPLPSSAHPGGSALPGVCGF